MYEIIDKNNVKVISFKHLTDTSLVKAFYTTKLGGVSTGIYESMNLSFNLEDDNKNVIKNFEILANAMDIDYNKFTLSAQIHETNVKVIREEDIGKGLSKESDFTSVDAMITNLQGVCLVTRYADCLPIIMLDKNKKVIAATHAGWRGTVENIVSKTIKAMQREFNSNIEDILVSFGPSICKECFEVGEDVKNEFYKKLENMIEVSDVIVEKENEKYLINILEINKRLLLNLGLKEENIDLSNLCTMCRDDLFFSHRKQGLKRGSQIAVVCLL